MRLVQGSQVVIVGGGPAGSYTALHLLWLAAQAHLDIRVTILEPRDFSRPGPGGCNKCAGILSSSHLHNLNRYGLELPPDIIQCEINAYILHLQGKDLPLNRPDPNRRIVSVYRGGGPLQAGRALPRSFDDWLLGQARLNGADIRRERVRSVKRGTRPVVITARDKMEPDLLVLATGVNSQAPLEPAWGYRPPRTETMAQDEVPLLTDQLKGNIHIFFDQLPGLLFGGVIPKGNYANISLLGSHLPPDAIGRFLANPEVTRLLPKDRATLCGCQPRVAMSPASGYYADRMVVVGDAAITRLYKDGIGSAFNTARAAARTAIFQGISQQDFAAGYQPICNQIAKDNLFGRLLFRLWAFPRRSTFLLRAWRQAINVEAHLPATDRVQTRALWAMFTGDESYRKIFSLSLGLRSWLVMMQGIVKAWRDD
jgi:flavin-dependent dehydrogenase